LKRTPPGQVYAGGSRNFDERTGRYRSPPIMEIPGMPPGPIVLGEGGVSPGQVPMGRTGGDLPLPSGPIPRTQVPTGPMPRTGGSMPVDESVRTMEFIDRNGNGIDDRDEKPPRGDAVLQPIKQPPIRVPPQTGGPMPLPNSGSPSSDDLFGPANYGSYDNLMSRAFQEYSGGQSPYAGATDFLMNRSVFDRGVRPESSMPSTTMPSFGYSNQGGMDGLSQMQAQQPAMQAQYDQFAQDIQSAQEAAQQAAQEQSDLASSERQALMDRIGALEGQEGPDLDAFGAQLRQDILGEVDIDALRREITGEVLQIAQQDFPDVTQIRDEIMALLPEQEQIDVENLRRQIQESMDAGAPPDEIAALRQELQNRIRPVEEQLQGLQSGSTDIAQQLGELQGQVGSLPDIDVDAIAQFRENFDPAALREQIGNLRGRLEGLPNFDIDEIRRRVQEGIELPNSNEIQDNLRRAMEERGGFVPPEVLERLRAVEQREGPDEAAIAERVRSGIDPRIADLRERLGSVGEFGQSMAERVAALREQGDRATQERSTLEERLGGRLEEVRGQVTPLTERIAQLRGRLDERPTVDMDAIARRVREGIDIPQVDLGGIREQIANLRGRLDERVPAGTAGIKPLPAPPKSPPKAPPRMGTFPPGFRGRGRGNI